MEMTIDQLVEMKVKEELAKHRLEPRKISQSWLDLRKEIDEYIKNNKYRDDNIQYSTLLSTIHKPIKWILGLRKIDEMTDEQSVVAREVFYYLREKKFHEKLKESK